MEQNVWTFFILFFKQDNHQSFCWLNESTKHVNNPQGLGPKKVEGRTQWGTSFPRFTWKTAIIGK